MSGNRVASPCGRAEGQPVQRPPGPARGQLLGLAGGDVMAAWALADGLLDPGIDACDRRAARLLLAALCLHLDGENGPEPQLPDLARRLSAARHSARALRVLADSPMGFLRYACAELESLEAPALRRAIELGVRAVSQSCGEERIKPHKAVKRANTA
jgi:hypothetical protein